MKMSLGVTLFLEYESGFDCSRCLCDEVVHQKGGIVLRAVSEAVSEIARLGTNHSCVLGF